jgi:hypothetical protein
MFIEALLLIAATHGCALRSAGRCRAGHRWFMRHIDRQRRRLLRRVVELAPVVAARFEITIDGVRVATREV